MRANGFTVQVEETSELDRISAQNGVPSSLRSCHTAIVDGYVVEGHVPASDVQRLLTERPDVVGIGVPDMPVGSPGMEVPGLEADAYDVLTFDAAGTTSVFSSHD